MADLAMELSRREGRPYPAYRDLRGGEFEVGLYRLRFEHVQPDPFAAPSRLRIDVPAVVSRMAPGALAGPDARRAAADFFHRAVFARLHRQDGGVAVSAPGQEVLERTAVRVAADGSMTIRCGVELPAAGRRIRGRDAARLLTEHLPTGLDAALRAHDPAALLRQVAVVEDQVALRAVLAARGLVAFVAEGSQLARRSGVDDRPLAGGLALRVPDALAVTLVAPHAGAVRGLGIPAGVTLIVGGGYHGKSTLLDALAHGVYDHIPDDGRERCVTVDEATVIRAEDGRPVRGVDLRPFITHLPLGRSTECFDTDDASGSTSQAANIIEALEVGATALLIDEDTAATNFMLRDARMRQLVPADEEPITPFLDRVRQLATDRGVSSVLVVGGAGDYLDVADRVIRMVDYQPVDVTAAAWEIRQALPLGAAAPHPPTPWPVAAPRCVDLSALQLSQGERPGRVRARGDRAIAFGDEEIDVSGLAQLVEPGQCRMIADVLAGWSRGAGQGDCTVAELVAAVEARVTAHGLDAVTAPGFGDRTRARRLEIAGAFNRLARLRIYHG